MSKSAWSLLVYGLYIGSAGVAMLLVPQLFIRVFALPAGSEVMLRFGGVLSLALGFYDVLSARAELRVFFRWSVFTRAFAFVAFGAMFALGRLPASLMLIGVVDLGCAGWTWMTLRPPRFAAS